MRILYSDIKDVASIIQEEVTNGDTTTTYIGYIYPDDTANTLEHCAILRSAYNSVNNSTIMTWSNGSMICDVKWSDRTNVDYYPLNDYKRR